MKKKIICSFLLGITMLMPTSISAQSSGTPGSQGDNRPHLIPSRQLFNISYDAELGDVEVYFKQTIPQATLFIYKDGSMIAEDDRTGIQAGDTATYSLSLFGTGLFTVYIKIGERVYAVFEEEIEELPIIKQK